ncbi:MAG: pantoate kinase [Halobacteriaceae archaeon]
MGSPESATAFAPGHVTAFFSVHRHEDPVRAGSRGAGVATSDGVTTTVTPADETTVTLNGAETVIEPVERVLDTLGVTAHVVCETTLPLGAGFGVSGAAALGTAFAADAAVEMGHSENRLVTVAHVAEVQSGTGLGDVVGQARGGLPVRLDPGAPTQGRLDGVPATGRVEYLTFGDLSTAEVIEGDVTDLSAAGARALDSLRDRPTPARLVDAGRAFAREADLLVDEVRAVLDAVPEASMAMLGRSVFAFGTALTDAGYDASVCEIDHAGARRR